MPRPHYPAQGGPHVSAWNAAYARLPRRAELFAPPAHEDMNNPASSLGTAGAGGQAVSPFLPRPAAQTGQGQTEQTHGGHWPPTVQERSRLQAAAAQTQALRDMPKTGTTPSVRATPASLSALSEESFKRRGVVWLAAVLCAMAAVFALLAIRWHG